MGSYKGHVLPGSFFLAMALWGWFNVLKIYYRTSKARRNVPTSFKSTTWFPVPIKWLRDRPIEPIIRAFAAILGISLELFRNNSYILIGKDGDLEHDHLNNYGHAAMYTIFAIWSLVEVLMFYNVIQLPNGSGFLFAAVALFVEGILFFFHLDGRPRLDVLVHTFLYVIIFMSAGVMILEGWAKDSFLLLVVRVFLFFLQGTWFIQIAHSLHGSQPWKNIKPNQEFVSILFSWHIIFIFFIMIIGFVVVSIKARGFDCRANVSRRRRLEEDTIEVQTINGDEHETRVLMDEEL